MNLAELAIKNRLISILVMVLVMAGGWLAYQNMPRFEDPEFTIRSAQIFTRYPGATPQQVVDEVTDKLETALQEMQEVEEIRSTSSDGLSVISVDILFEFSPSKSDLQIIWTKLRNKVNDARATLPSGASTPIVNDDFGDVFGMYYLLTGDGYTQWEVLQYAKQLRKDLLTVDGVGKVSITGDQTEAIYIEISRERAASLGVSLTQVYSTLSSQNSTEYAGSIELDGRRVVFQPSGEINSVDAIKNLKVALGGTSSFTTIGEIADVKREYVTPASYIMRYDGRPALGIGVSNVSGANVVKMGQGIEAKLAEIEKARPLGIELHEYYNQGEIVDASVKDFAVNVGMALAIVLVTLLIFMGYRSALVIGAVLILTISGTLAVMNYVNIPMHRISLGALIIALGMLVDNAIVVTEGILVGTKAGETRLEAAKKIVTQTKWPLLGGTIVGILAFAPIGFAEGSTAEFTGSLFWVICISLLFSWIFALTLAPFLAYLLFNDGGEEDKLSHTGPTRFARLYSAFLDKALRVRWLVLGGAVVAFAASVWAFQFVKGGFFPASTTPQIVVDVWLPQGTDISQTDETIRQIENYAGSLDGVSHVQSLIGGGTLRYMLIYNFENQNSAYGQLLIKTKDFNAIAPLMPKLQTYLDTNFQEAQAKVWRFAMGPGGGSKIEVQFTGPDPKVLRDLSRQAQFIMQTEPDAIFIKEDWRQSVPVIVPLFSEDKARRVGVSRSDLSSSIAENFDGVAVGMYREGDDNLVIYERSPADERIAATDIYSMRVRSSATGESIPITEVVNNFQTIWRDGIIKRVDRLPAIQTQCDPAEGVVVSDLQAKLRPKIEAINLPEGYYLEWNGELGNSAEAQQSLFAIIPLGILAMVLTVVLLFNAIRQPLVIWLIVPTALIGVVIGLITTGSPMEFMAILGVLSLSGLLIKNAIVLVDQMDVNIREGQPRYTAVLNGAASRVRPVMMGSLTTILGLIPLMGDPFFRSMAVVLIFGLSFATLITLVLIPVNYSIFFRIRSSEVDHGDIPPIEAPTEAVIT